MKSKFLYWTPRILAILAILFMMMFSLDCFEEGVTNDILICFVMHNIPAFILIIALVIAWKWEMIGGILFLASFLVGCIFFGVFKGNWGAGIIMLPFAITGALFLFHHNLYRKRK
jgi:hypothetical protein